MLPFKILTQEKFDAITLVEAKSQCRVTPSNNMDDDFICNLICISASVAQEYLHWMVSRGTVKIYSVEGGWLSLYGSNVTAITEVTAIDNTGVVVTLTEDDYIFNEVTQEVYVDDYYYSCIYITYTAGATADELDWNVKGGILMLISTMYNNREDFITGLTVEKMPTTSTTLLSLSRIYVS